MKSKAAITNSAILTVSLSVFLGVPILTNAQSLESIIPGIIEGTGTHFETTNSEYINIVLDSSEEIELTIESIPGMVTMMIKPVSSGSTTQITLSGFTPLTTYYKYQDDYHNLTEFMTDENGSYAYTQDLSEPHLIFIQTRKSTKFIKDDFAGGDCTSIGIWDLSTKTCTLNTDVNETIQIDSDGITLDGDGHLLSGSWMIVGIYLYKRTEVIIKNLDIEKYAVGIQVRESNNNTFINNTLNSNSGYGLIFYPFSSDNTVTKNTFSNNRYFGVHNIFYSNNNKIYNNNFIGNLWGQALVDQKSTGNIFNLDPPIGGNYWDDFDKPAEGCEDLNNDGFCDLPYVFRGGQDNYPWTKQDGWITKTLSEQAAELAKLVINAPYLGDGDTYGGKGWDPEQALYVSSNDIFNGYNYWNNKLRTIAFGSGLDCSGLTQWAFNRSLDPSKSLLRNAIRYDGADGQYKNNTELFLDKDGNNYIDHVAMYVGNNGIFDIVEAFSPERGIITSVKSQFKTRVGFVESKHIRRVAVSPSLGGQVKVGSPIDLIVTDPDGVTITPPTVIQTDEEYLREIPGELYYTENVLGPDGRPEDIIYWPTQKTGNYIIKVIPEVGVSSTETYNLEFQTGNQTIVLAENTPLNQIPTEGYGVSVTETGTITPFIPVVIDIKPDSFPNSINLNSKGTIPVAILGNNAFDVYQINLDSVTLRGAPIKPKKNGQLMANYEDVNKDGFTDVVIHVITEALKLTPTDAKAELNGLLLDGKEIKGSDYIKIVP